MPVQFVCTHCRRTLSVGQRKAGATVACPKCGTPNLVPRLEPAPVGQAAVTAPAGVAYAEPEISEPEPAALPEALVFDEIPDLIAMIDSMPVAAPSARAGVSTSSAAKPDDAEVDPSQPTAARSAAPTASPLLAPPPPTALQSPSRLPPNTLPDAQAVFAIPPPVQLAAATGNLRGRRRDDAMLLVSRQMVYAQAALMAVVALAALTAGYLIGRGAHRESGKAEAVSASEPVPLEGHIRYALSTDVSEPDTGALVLVLPADNRPIRKLSASEFVAGESEASDSAAREALESLGGTLASADGDGRFRLVVPQPGDYFLLIISNHAKRSGDRPMAAKHLDRLSEYFDSAAELTAGKRYAWLSRKLIGAPPPIRHEFSE